MVNGEMEFRNESQLPLLAARLGNRLVGERGNQRFVVGEESERTTFGSGEGRSNQLGVLGKKGNSVAEEG